MTFPVGVYKAMRSVTEGIHRISLANNELKSITSRFVTTFSQLTGKGLPLPILWDIPAAPKFLQKGQSTQESPLSSHLIASISSDPQKSISPYIFCPLKEEDTDSALTHPSKLVLGCCGVTHHPPAPSKDGAEDGGRQERQLGENNGAWKGRGNPGCAD